MGFAVLGAQRTDPLALVLEADGSRTDQEPACRAAAFPDGTITCTTSWRNRKVFSKEQVLLKDAFLFTLTNSSRAIYTL